MEIRPKLYPYPVLSYYSDDYIGSNFNVEINAQPDGYNFKLIFKSELDDEILQGYIASEDVNFVYHLECAQTGFRNVLKTSLPEITHIIPDKNIRGQLQICPFIVAMKDLPSYVNGSFNEDYRGFKFAIEAGCVMAVAKQINIEIEKDINDLSQTPSIFSIIKNADETELGMLVDMYKTKIVIKLPEKDYYNFKSIRDEADIQPVLNSIVVIPALLFVLEELCRLDPNSRDELNVYSWYRVIKRVLSLRFNTDIESDKLSSLNMIEVSQKLINTPLSDGLHVLSTGYENSGEDDEE
jgi:hypothetical protein